MRTLNQVSERVLGAASGVLAWVRLYARSPLLAPPEALVNVLRTARDEIDAILRQMEQLPQASAKPPKVKPRARRAGGAA